MLRTLYWRIDRYSLRDIISLTTTPLQFFHVSHGKVMLYDLVTCLPQRHYSAAATIAATFAIQLLFQLRYNCYCSLETTDLLTPSTATM